MNPVKGANILLIASYWKYLFPKLILTRIFEGICKKYKLMPIVVS